MSGADRSPAVSILVNGTVYYDTKEYSLDQNILSLGDPFRVVIPSPEGTYGGAITVGDTVEFVMSDPDVGGGKDQTRLKGIVTNLEAASDSQAGTAITISGADLGWHLANNCGPLWFNLSRVTWAKLLDAVLDASWGFVGVRDENDTNRKLNMGRAGINLGLQRMDNYLAILPPIQIEPGMMIADVLIHYARLSKCLVNVSSDGYLQVFQPRYDTPALYKFRYHKSTDVNRDLNNVKSARLTQSIDGIYTSVTCLGTIIIPPKFINAENPNRGKFKSIYVAEPSPLPFLRRLTFTDQEQLNRTQAGNRARWKADRGQFDSWTYEITVPGHAQGGYYFAADTMCDVDDTVLGVTGVYYVSAVKMARDRQGGSTTTLTIKKPNLLRA